MRTRILKINPNYSVSECGKVINNKTGRVLKPGTTNDGYLSVTLSYNGVVKSYRAHRLVASEWLSSWDDNLTVDHIDNVKTNNDASNLQMLTASANSNKEKKSDLPLGIQLNLACKNRPYRARVHRKGKHYGSCHATIEEAIIAHKELVRIHGEPQGKPNMYA